MEKKIAKVTYNGKTLMDISEDTVTEETLAEEETAHRANGVPIRGTARFGGDTTDCYKTTDDASTDLADDDYIPFNDVSDSEKPKKKALFSTIVDKLKNTFATVTQLNTKQDSLTFDNVPTDGSNNPVKSNGIYDADKEIQDQVNDIVNVYNSKNLLRLNGKTETINGVKFTPQADGTILVNGTASADTYFAVRTYFSNGILQNSEYKDLIGKSLILSGCPSGGSGSTYRLQFHKYDGTNVIYDYGSGSSAFTVTDASSIANVYVHVSIRIAPGITMSNVVFKPMLRLASIKDDTFVPYVPTNSELVRWDEMEIYGSKNLLKNFASTKTENGITFTVSADGTVNVNGTASAQTDLIIASNYPLNKGNYILSGCPSGGSGRTYVLFAGSGFTGSTLYDTGEGKYFSILGKSQANIVIRIMNGQTVSNLVFKPMIRLASVKDDTYVPYAPTNSQVLSYYDNGIFGAKNLFFYEFDSVYYDASVAGLSITNNDDGSYTISSGTVPSGTEFLFPYCNDSCHVMAKMLKPNTRYIFSIGAAYSDVRLQVYVKNVAGASWTNLADQKNVSSVTFSTPSSIYVLWARVQIDGGTTISSGFSIKPMIYAESYNDDTFCPPAMTNYALTKRIDQKTFIGTCSTEASSRIKYVTVDDEFRLIKGVRIAVKFTNTNTYSSSTSNPIQLNVNNTEPRNIWYDTTHSGAGNTGTKPSCYGTSNRHNYYVYDGTYWVWDGYGVDTNTTYPVLDSSTLTTGTDTALRIVRADYLKSGIKSLVGNLDGIEIDIPDNGGKKCYLLFADVTTWFNSTTTGQNTIAFEGVLISLRGWGNFRNKIVQLGLGVTYQKVTSPDNSNLILKSTYYQYVPRIIKNSTTNKYYLALYCSLVGNNVTLIGKWRNIDPKTINSDSFVICTDNSGTLPSEWSVAIDGYMNLFDETIVGDIEPRALGFSYGECSTAASTTAKTVDVNFYYPRNGSISVIRFSNDVPANATLNINNHGNKNILYKGNAITAGIIKAGDNALFITDGNTYKLIAVDRDFGSYLPLSGGTIENSNLANINSKSLAIDAKSATNGVSSTLSPTTSNLLDKNGLIIGRLEGLVYANGDIGQNWYVRNYDTSGNNMSQKGIKLILNKLGVLTYTFGDPANALAALGTGYGICNTAASTAAKTATLRNYTLVTNGYVTIYFQYDVPANATLNINSKGAKAIYCRGAAITAGKIKAGDRATFVYNGTQYDLVSNDGWGGR